MARPKLPARDEIYELASQGCTPAEIAGRYRVKEETIKARYETELKDGKLAFKLAIRRAQTRWMEKGNPAMLIWMGKNYLGQSDNVHARSHGAPPIQIEIKTFPARGQAEDKPALELEATRLPAPPVERADEGEEESGGGVAPESGEG